MIKKNSAIWWACIISLLVSGCATHSIISQTYDFGSVHRIGVLRVNTHDVPVEGVEDLFAQYLLKDGFTVVERAKLKAIMKENNINATGLINPTMTKQLGQLLGVDVLLMGEISGYIPEKETTTIARTENTFVEPVYATERVVQDGKSMDVIKQTGTNIRREVNQTPLTYTTSPQVGLIAKLVDVETAQVVWVGSITKQGDTVMEAAENAVSYLVENLKNDMSSVLKKKAKK